MRYEAKHSYFKKLISNIGNFINLPYTLAMRHQKLAGIVDVGTGNYNRIVLTSLTRTMTFVT